MANLLPGGNVRCLEISGKLTQSARDRSSETFRQRKDGYTILVTSDVSAREGLIIPESRE